MAQLLVRQVDDAVVEAPKRRAAAHHRSAEAEHRAILESAAAGRRLCSAGCAVARRHGRPHQSWFSRIGPTRPRLAMTTIVDASVALKWVIEEQGSDPRRGAPWRQAARRAVVLAGRSGQRALAARPTGRAYLGGGWRKNRRTRSGACRAARFQRHDSRSAQDCLRD